MKFVNFVCDLHKLYLKKKSLNSVWNITSQHAFPSLPLVSYDNK